MAYTIGIDFGTNSVRALVVDCRDGSEVGSTVVPYPSGEKGVLLDPKDHNLARQNPADYLYGLERSVRDALTDAGKAAPFSPEEVIGIGVDTTGSSPLPVDAANRPLALDPKWKGCPAAQCWLWKDHTSHAEAAEITELAARERPEFIAKCGAVYSSEWFWSKILRCRRTAPEVFAAAYSWVELCDWIPSVLAGVQDPAKVMRGICAAGHKALYHDDWNGLPDEEFLGRLDPELAKLRGRLYPVAHDASMAAGELCGQWAKALGLPAGLPITIGQLDVHYGAIGCGIAEGALVKVIGTSTCDCAVISADKKVADIPGICGIVPGAILPGFYGIEAGQSAVGDIFDWWVRCAGSGEADLHEAMTHEVAAQRPGQSGLLALDWNHGNRTILVDPLLSGLLLGQTLHTTRAEIYRALIEATAFGARTILERIQEYGVTIERIVCAGGIAVKNPMLMQIYADVTGCTMKVAASDQACALGAAVSAAVLAGEARGGYANFPDAQAAMTALRDVEYQPIPENMRIYNQLYALYGKLHDAFGGVDASANLAGVMKDLHRIKEQQTR